MTEVNKNYKDTVFRMIFKEKKELLSLYNAVNGTSYSNPDELVINTLENAIYLNIKNDVSCILDMRMNLYEHQSSVNPNMPLRNLFYVARQYEKFTKDRNIYSSAAILLPTPKFITFYNGVEPQPERCVMRLSDSFQKKSPQEEAGLELIVTQLNINPGFNEELKENCPTLENIWNMSQGYGSTNRPCHWKRQLTGLWMNVSKRISLQSFLRNRKRR